LHDFAFRREGGQMSSLDHHPRESRYEFGSEEWKREKEAELIPWLVLWLIIRHPYLAFNILFRRAKEDQ
jgi:hypothetical protein